MATKKVPPKKKPAPKKKAPPLKIVLKKVESTQDIDDRPKRSVVRTSTKRVRRHARDTQDAAHNVALAAALPQREYKGADKYDKSFDVVARKIVTLGGTLSDLAEALGIDEQSVRLMALREPSFNEAIRDGRRDDIATAESSLHRRMTGFYAPEEKIFYNSQDDKVIRVQTDRYYPPDTAAAIFWLKNRAPNEWKDRRELTMPDAPNKRLKIVIEDVDPDGAIEGELA